MWVSKFILNGDSALFGMAAKELSLNFAGYPISYERKRDCIHVCFGGYIFGDSEKKKKILEFLKNSKRVLNFEESRGFVIGRLKESLEVGAMYDHRLIHLEPVLIKEDGTEEWVIGSWNKRYLTKFSDIIEKKFHGELVSMSNRKISNFSMISMNQPLTENQKSALDLAITKGYYEYPRKIDLKSLAKIFGCSYSTYQSHLRKAENKTIPFAFKKSFI